MTGSELEEHVNTSQNPQKYIGEGMDFGSHPRWGLGLLLFKKSLKDTLGTPVYVWADACLLDTKVTLSSSR